MKHRGKTSKGKTWSNRPPEETILLDDCDFEHWLVVVEKPEGEPTKSVVEYFSRDVRFTIQHTYWRCKKKFTPTVCFCLEDNNKNYACTNKSRNLF